MWSDFLDFRATTVTLELPRRLGNRRLPGERPSATPPLTTAPTLEVIVSSGECHRRVEVVDTGCEMDDLGVWVSMPGLWHSTGCCSPGGAAYMDITVLKTIGHADLHRCADPPCGVAPLMRPAAGPGPASNIPVPRPQARPGTRPIRQAGSQKPLFQRFCPRVLTPIFAPKYPTVINYFSIPYPSFRTLSCIRLCRHPRRGCLAAASPAVSRSRSYGVGSLSIHRFGVPSRLTRRPPIQSALMYTQAHYKRKWSV